MDDCLILEETESTNSVAEGLARDGALHGFAVLAKKQTGGRGRLGRFWVSPGGLGLYCTIILRPNLELIDYPKLTLAAGVAVAEALAGLGVITDLKWPNDIFIAGRKCGGILVESSALEEESANNYALVGIGLNVNTTAVDFDKLSHQAISLRQACGGKIFNIDEIFSVIRKAILAEVCELERHGFARILDRWQRYDLLRGRRARWLRNDGVVVEGLAEGIDDQGQLLVRTDDGVIHPVISGDVNLVQHGSTK
ncbi:MAG: biotin--[acetyl-CoA-carboxylase] ligase [Desulfobulbaceae bacterium]|uniref:biotin--[biotin carboxyl-carrier protein] ligase n=1 Tax=Candidatus Desulfatifera sulfidica TaxID=2841691 RepID=A0A8J6N8S1_9BACT|nr:biotin--[acetyl-CoA-carboxylase] ligase [Candidatus Desulfatifera sulfidica]